MKRIGLTQRVSIEQTGERRDCLDQQWSLLAGHLNFVPVPLPNLGPPPEICISELDLSGVILTGGNDLASLGTGRVPAPERDAFEMSLLDVCIARDLPVFAVCRGMQVVNVHLGGKLSLTRGHAATRHPVYSVANGVTQTRQVNSYHDYGILVQDLAKPLALTWRTEDGWAEGARHVSAKLIAQMWHPEREGPQSRTEDLREIAGLFGL